MLLDVGILAGPRPDQTVFILLALPVVGLKRMASNLEMPAAFDRASSHVH